MRGMVALLKRRGRRPLVLLALIVLGLATVEPASASYANDATLSAITGFPVECYSPDSWQQIVPAPNVVGLTTSAISNGQLVSGPTIELPQWVCQQAESLVPSVPATLQQVQAVRILGHEWGNATEQAHQLPDPGELNAACFGQQQFWPLMQRLGGIPWLNPTKAGRRAFTDRMLMLTALAQQTGPVTTCWQTYRNAG